MNATAINTNDALALLPLFLLAGTAVVVMLGIAVKRSHELTAGLTLAGLAASFLSVFTAAPLVPRQVTSLLLIDGYALFFLGLIIASAAAVAVLSYQYFAKHDGQREELYLLLVLATLGCGVLVTSIHFVSFLLGLEILSISLYGMVAYFTDRGQTLEAGIKYLILASASAAFLLFGLALIYADTGTLSFSSLRNLPLDRSSLALVLPGIALTVTGIGFKLGVVPFHLWIPDVYEGAPAPVAAFVATTSKTAVVALLLRYLAVGTQQSRALFFLLSVIAVASMCAGNLLALRQNNVKRVLAYSSIAHFGYILVAFLAGTTMGASAVAFYLVAYTVTILAAFGIVTVLSTSEADAADLEDYRGLFWRRPVLASIFTAVLFSLAGIPATMGFIGKFYILASGANASAWPLMLVLVLTSVIGLFYYLRIVVTLFSASPERQFSMQRVGRGSAFVLGGLAVLLIWFGVYPAPLLNLIRATIGGLN
ncbi:MAG TPA: NADH-quinone oxidoreductase subunit N [Candidatus Sulfotelmatobacter sp.]|nr:NADH-quinone oxidoreductase subunit N [Candidatus Sulfotelmatobacter sp.]